MHPSCISLLAFAKHVPAEDRQGPDAKTPWPGGDGHGAYIEGQRPGEGGRPLSGLTRRGTSLQSDYGVISRRPQRNEAANAAFQGKPGLQICNVLVSGEGPVLRFHRRPQILCRSGQSNAIWSAPARLTCGPRNLAIKPVGRGRALSKPMKNVAARAIAAIDLFAIARYPCFP